MTPSGRHSTLLKWFLIAACLLLTAGLLDAALAQPFGISRAGGGGEVGGFAGWILHQQADFYRMLSGAIRAAKADGSAAWTLLGISFLYGIFHAAGPGHGKAVISSYLVANNETWRRGITLSFASALLQALVAIALVGIASVVLHLTSRAMGDAVRYIEIASYALIIVIGLQLFWRKGRAFLAAWRGEADHHDDHDHNHDHGHHAHDHDAHDHHAHDHHGCDHHAHDDHHDHHGHDDHHGHSHGPEPAELAGPGGWRRGFAAIVAVGLRPCSGAILVLVFALAQGIFWAGIGATLLMGLGTAITVALIATLAVSARGLAGRLAKTGDGKGTLFLRGIEVAAALVVIAFGVLLLAGYIASERMFA